MSPDRSDSAPHDPLHHRRSIRVPLYDYAGPGAYFVTTVTEDRANVFGRIMGVEMQLSTQGRIAEACWRAIPEHFARVELGPYVVMPNHVHGIIVIHDQAAMQSPPVGATQWVAPTPDGRRPIRPHGPPRGSIGAIIGAYKSAVTRTIVREFGGVPHIWQRNYYEHIIRDEDDWNRIHLYIEANVANWAEDAENPLR
jgi:putative transposase